MNNMDLIKKLAVMVLLLAAAVSARAYDFAEPAPSGQTLYFSIVEGGVEVVYPANVVQPTLGWTGYQKPSGALTIPSTVTHDGVTYNVLAVRGHAFYSCDGLVQLTVQQGVHALRANAFNGCSALTAVSLPASLDSLASSVFANCNSLLSVTMHSDMPPYCTSFAFTGVDLSGVSLTVPCNATDNYSGVAPWNSFGEITEGGCDVTLVVGANYADRGTVSGGGTYAEGTVVVMSATPAEGFFFACWSDGDTLNPRMIQLQQESAYTACFFAIMYDTVYSDMLHDTVEVHDTVVVVEVHTDTVRDTVTDTVYTIVQQTDTLEVHDTLVVHVEGRDTITLTLYDTVYPTFFRLTVDGGVGGIGIGNATLPAGTVAEFGVLPLEGYAFVRWSDGSGDNPRRETLTGDMVYTAVMEELAIPVVDVSPWTLAVDGRLLTIGCEPGQTVRLYSVDGRRLLATTAAAHQTHVRLTAAGVYLVQVGNGPARKVIVEN